MKKQMFEKMDNIDLDTQYDIPWLLRYSKIKAWNESAEDFMNYIPLEEEETMEEARIKKQEEVYFNELVRGDIFIHECKAFIKTRVRRTVGADGQLIESNAVSLHSGIGYWFDISDKVEKAKVFIPLVEPKEPNPESKEPKKPYRIHANIFHCGNDKNCDAFFTKSDEYRYCPFCGTKIDWSDYNG